MSFVIHPRLLAGSSPLGYESGCHILLKNNALFPWVLVVPEVDEGVEDLHQLDGHRFAEVMAVVRKASRFVENHFRPEKLNVACIGNQIRQMHIHVVARSPGDAAWPGVVWSFESKTAYSNDEAKVIMDAWRNFSDDGICPASGVESR